MPSIGPAIEIGKTMSASPKTIADEANVGFKLALVGTPEHRTALRSALLTDRATVLELDEAEHYLREFDAAPDADTSKAFAFTLYAGPEGEPIGVRGYNSVPFTGSVDEIVSTILGQRPDLAVALARRLPKFRIPACNQLIRATSRLNAWVAIFSALPNILPPIGDITWPATSVADVLLLTKNQVILVMRLAAAHGRPVHYLKQAKEIVATAGGAVGWRTLARELVGLVPAGVGAMIKAGIAYSGTVAVGKAALIYYQTGKRATPEQVRAAYEESQEEAKREVQALRES